MPKGYNFILAKWDFPEEDAVPVNVKSMNGLVAMAKLGVPDLLMKWLSNGPVQIDVVLTASAFQFTAQGMPGAVVGVPVNVSTLQQIANNTLSDGEKQKLRAALMSAIEFIMKGTGTGDPAESALAMLPKSAVSAAAAPAPPAPAAPPKPKKWDAFDIAKLAKAPQVKLRDAERMYQPVFGTSEGSRYFLVGGNADLRVAARYTGSKLSVRIEGPHWEKALGSISACGFKTDKAQGYASIHLTVPSEMLAMKALGAVLLGLGVTLETPLPDLKVIKNVA
jgi:hypothetical protein